MIRRTAHGSCIIVFFFHILFTLNQMQGLARCRFKICFFVFFREHVSSLLCQLHSSEAKFIRPAVLGKWTYLTCSPLPLAQLLCVDWSCQVHGISGPLPCLVQDIFMALL